MPNELSEKVYPDGTVVKLRDDTAREQIAGITDGMDIKIAAVTWPSSGTPIQRATDIITQIISGMSFTKPFNVIDIKSDNMFRAQILYQVVSGGSYGMGLYFSYYQDYVYRFVNTNGTITVKQLAEV